VRAPGAGDGSGSIHGAAPAHVAAGTAQASSAARVGSFESLVSGDAVTARKWMGPLALQGRPRRGEGWAPRPMLWAACDYARPATGWR